MIASKEMLRAKVRFGLLIGAIALLVFLILFQQALRDGLITSFVGAIEHQTAPVLVYSTDARRNLQSSSITPELEAQVRAVDGVARRRSHRAEHVQRAAPTDDHRRRRSSATSGVRSARRSRSSPAATRPPTGEGVANETDASRGLRPRRRRAGGARRLPRSGSSASRRDTNLQAIARPCSCATARGSTAVRAANPDARTPPPNALGVAPAAGSHAERAGATDRRGEHRSRGAHPDRRRRPRRPGSRR